MESWVKQKGAQIGFDLVAISPAKQYREHLKLNDWLAKQMHASMSWMERSLEKRLDPKKIMPEAKSLITCALNYNTPYPYSTQIEDSEKGWIARYAWGKDYHDVVKKKLEEFSGAIKNYTQEEIHIRSYVDTGPIMERVFAKNSGIGWIGKNTCIINTKMGSWLFLGLLLTDLNLKPDSPATDHCGTCTACIDACPTQAITKPYEVDARKCISYLTIEHKGKIPDELSSKMGNHLFGCDICQDVCPWNKKAPTTDKAEFEPRENFNSPSLAQFFKLLEEYPTPFSKSPLKRAKKEGLQRNLAIAIGNSKNHALRYILDRLLISASDEVKLEARVALEKLEKKNETS